MTVVRPLEHPLGEEAGRQGPSSQALGRGEIRDGIHHEIHEEILDTLNGKVAYRLVGNLSSALAHRVDG